VTSLKLRPYSTIQICLLLLQQHRVQILTTERSGSSTPLAADDKDEDGGAFEVLMNMYATELDVYQTTQLC